ncbi:MAG: fatty acid desaturase [Flaviaesturariibacter sp.]|nr:fatty acid desaturase [Flaviaesturariibacter sp.]
MAKVTFNNRNNLFFQSLKKSVDDYFKTNNIKKTGDWRLYSKALILVPLCLAIYIVLLTNTPPLAISLVLCAILGMAIGSIGFNIMHDACHGAYSSKKWVNTLFGYTLNAVGGNTFFWKLKHNILHHTYTNIHGVDDDIAQSKLLRQSPTQEWWPIHRYQHIYLTVAYSLTIFMWAGVRDFEKYFKKKVYNTPISPMSWQDHVIFWVSKAAYAFFYIVLPIMMVGWQAWLIGYLTMGIVIGVVISYVFQLAHAVEGPEFSAVGLEDKQIETEWAVHQIKTTANFAPKNKFINWYVGGLNFQVEHHLFPRISHIHYPALSQIVQDKCKEFGLPYHSFNTLGEAIASHVRLMKHLGQKPAIAMNTSVDQVRAETAA